MPVCATTTLYFSVLRWCQLLLGVIYTAHLLNNIFTTTSKIDYFTINDVDMWVGFESIFTISWIVTYSYRIIWWYRWILLFLGFCCKKLFNFVRIKAHESFNKIHTEHWGGEVKLQLCKSCYIKIQSFSFFPFLRLW